MSDGERRGDFGLLWIDVDIDILAESSGRSGFRVGVSSIAGSLSLYI